MGRAAVFWILLASSAVWAADETEGTYWAQAGLSCGKLVEVRKLAQGRHEFGLWLAGFITAYNLVTPNTFNILGNTDMDSAELWIENYCRANPLATGAAAAVMLTRELHPRRHRTAQDARR